MELYITVTGHKHYYGLLPFYVGEELLLKAEPDNLYEPKAIAVYTSKYGKVGFVAQSEEMCVEGTSSAASLFPLEETIPAVVRFIAGDYIIAEIKL